MTCAEMENALPDLLEGGRPDAAAAAHLESCDACRTRLADVRDLWGAEDDTRIESLAGKVPPAPSMVLQDLEATNRAVRTAPVLWAAGAALVVAGVLTAGIRSNFEELGWMLGPVTALVFFVLAAVALRMGLQLSGMRFRRGLALLGVVAIVFFFYGTLNGAMLSPEAQGAVMDRGDTSMRHGLACLTTMVLFSLPVLGVAAWLLRAARMPTLVSSIVLGAGASLLSAGALHLTCPISTVHHLMVYHGGGLVAVSVLTGVIGLFFGQRALASRT